LVTFFRLGKLKKFYKNQNGNAQEITFFDAVHLLECEPDTPRANRPSNYYDLLEINKQRFHSDTIQNAESGEGKTGGRSNLSYIEGRLNDPAIRKCKKYTDDDIDFINGIRRMLKLGTIAKKVAQTIKKEIDKTIDPLDVLAVLRKHIRVVDTGETTSKRITVKQEVILSGYLL